MLHFLPPYSPDDNLIERLWKQLHDPILRNHRRQIIDTLVEDVRRFLDHTQPFPGAPASTLRAAQKRCLHYREGYSICRVSIGQHQRVTLTMFAVITVNTLYRAVGGFNMDAFRKTVLASLTIVGTSIGINATADTASDNGFLQCFYECKTDETGSFWQEQTTLMIMNGNQPLTTGAHGNINVAHIAFLNGQEKIIGKTEVGLSSRDLDELNVCATLRKGTRTVPSAGLLQIAIDNEAISGPGKFVSGNGVDIAVKNPVGRMSPDEPEVFKNRITGIGKTPCFEIDAKPERLVFDPEYLEAPLWAPVLIEDTADPDDIIVTDVNN